MVNNLYKTYNTLTCSSSRWVKQMGVEIASEAKMRKEAKLYTSEDNLIATP